jgi:hypothetical protein
VPPRSICNHYLSGAAEPLTFTFLSSPAGAKHQPQPSQRPEDQPPSGPGSVLSPLKRLIEAEQPLSWRAPSVQPPSRARRGARRKSPWCAPKCKPSSSERPLWILRLVLLADIDSIFS